MKSAIAKAAGLTDVGLKRDGNEDSFSMDMNLGLFVVADGMGGHLAGEVASRVAVDLINKSFRKWVGSDAAEEDLFEYPDPSLSRIGNYVLSGIRLANRVINEMATENKEYNGMGTTVAVLAVMPELIITANVGDSRIYLVRKGQIEQLSRDHSIVAEQLEMGIMTEKEAEQSPLKHVLTRNLGSAKHLDADIFEIEPSSKDRFVLCSDGLTDLVSDDEIKQMVEAEDDPDVLCKKFIDKALTRGAHDNTTVVSIYMSDFDRRKSSPLGKIGTLLADVLTALQKVTRNFMP
ncbi:MAG: Stp1/IreP family PP2C-type Ser/Thr phosphatase [Desulfobacteraceae bacterium]|nr:MAG: Stp1/IreP family PP2C-type Ser/Thr phosphatase [Desulfobacteraceae bacterium]